MRRRRQRPITTSTKINIAQRKRSVARVLRSGSTNRQRRIRRGIGEINTEMVRSKNTEIRIISNNKISDSSKPIISIVMAYINRKRQLMATLRSIQSSSYLSKEVVIVDDGSDACESISVDDMNVFDFPVKTIVVSRHAFGFNSCVLYNLGFSHSVGDVIIIQNPENIHYGDIVSVAAEKIKLNRYILFEARSLDVGNSYILQSISSSSISKAMISNCLDRYGEGEKFLFRFEKRRSELHWCSVIMRSDLKELNGFDERFSNGIEFDDDELFLRVRRKNMEILFLDQTCPIVFHQYHKPVQTGINYTNLRGINVSIWHSIQSETSYRANPDKHVL